MKDISSAEASRERQRAAAAHGVAGQTADFQQAPGVSQGRLVEHPLQGNSRSDG